MPARLDGSEPGRRRVLEIGQVPRGTRTEPLAEVEARGLQLQREEVARVPVHPNNPALFQPDLAPVEAHGARAVVARAAREVVALQARGAREEHAYLLVPEVVAQDGTVVGRPQRAARAVDGDGPAHGAVVACGLPRRGPGVTGRLHKENAAVETAGSRRRLGL